MTRQVLRPALAPARQFKQPTVAGGEESFKTKFVDIWQISNIYSVSRVYKSPLSPKKGEGSLMD